MGARVRPAHDACETLMRPTLLNPLFAPVTTLPGVGPKQDKLLRYLLSRDETPRLVDLLLHLPASVIDRRAQPKIREAVQGTMVTLEVTVDRHRPPALKAIMCCMRIVLRGYRLQLALQPEQRCNSLQCQRLISMLRALLPRHDGEAARDVGGADGALGLVLMLAAGAAGAEGFKADIVDRERFRCLRQRR